MTGWRLTGWVVSVVIGSVIGGSLLVEMKSTGEDASPERITKIKYRDVYVETVPDSCVSAIKASEKSVAAAQQIMKVGTPQLDIISEGRQALITKSTSDLNKTWNHQRELSRIANEQVESLSIGLDDWKRFIKDCEEDIDE